MTKVISIICFILMIGLLIFIHELGHFLLAKKNGVGVIEFSVGLGPKLFSWTKDGTKYAIKLIPFGGYCMMLGDEGIASMADEDGEEVVSDPEHAFSKKPVWVRIAVIAAGPIFNFLLALLLAIVLVAMIGTTTTKIQGVQEGYPAAEAGLQAGDEIVKIDGHPMHIFKDVSMYIALHNGDPLNIVYKRNGEKFKTTIVPTYVEEDSRYYIGILGSARTKDLNILQILQYGFFEFEYNCGAVFKSLGMLFSGQASVTDLSGPVGMAEMVTDIVEEVKDDTSGESPWVTIYWTLVNLISFTVMISANLGIMNLLPIPAMDGGRLLFLFVEAVIRKPVPKKMEGVITLVGFGFLILLMGFVFFNDIKRIVLRIINR